MPTRIRVLHTDLVVCEKKSGPPICSPDHAGKVLADLIGKKDREHVVVLHLNARHQIVSTETVAIGTLTASLVSPREVFKGAIVANSHAIIVGHNHPSGDLSPSREDILVAERLRKAGEIIGIELLDFLVVAGKKHESINAKGRS